MLTNKEFDEFIVDCGSKTLTRNALYTNYHKSMSEYDSYFFNAKKKINNKNPKNIRV